ncbi:cation diffusion facilitator family transporter [Adhaeribacter soli]|uniref:Cation transporter n=1 Tax=Adhaeribacter soli TaxID=2607655 RepID=A0A5N1IHX2_9BACT|nr:cation diffusion facilitator family transporter [Adhaeribacter soli]KAA9325232.1 cation transporter [Adhaeribacter soli]
MAHGHHHHPSPLLTDLNRAFMLGLVLNIIFVVVEAGAGFYINSLSLLSDAGHNLSDVVSLGLAMLAFKLVKIKPTQKFTYGYQKSTILVALINAVILLLAIGSIGLEAYQRFQNPEAVPGKTVALVAGIGIFINAGTAMLFYKDKDKDLNVKGAYLHMAADALVSVGVVISGLVMFYTNWFWLDSIISFVIIIVIFFSTWNLLKETIRLSLDAVPENVDYQKVLQAMEEVPGVNCVYHIHIWALSTTRNALTAHVLLEPGTVPPEIRKIKEEIRLRLSYLNLEHVTLETDLIKHENEKPDGIC